MGQQVLQCEGMRLTNCPSRQARGLPGSSKSALSQELIAHRRAGRARQWLGCSYHLHNFIDNVHVVVVIVLLVRVQH